MEEEGKSPLEVAKEKTERVAHMALSLSRGVTSEQGSALVTNVLHSFTAGASEIKTGSEVMASHDTGDIVEQTNKEEGAGKDNGANVNTVDIGLLDECDRFEHNNAHLRERLTNLKMKRIRNERDAEERGTEKISQLILVRTTYRGGGCKYRGPHISPTHLLTLYLTFTYHLVRS